MGILRAGYTVVNVNPLYTPRELEHQLADSGAEAIVILENFATTLQAVIRKLPAIRHVVVTSMGDLLGLKGMLVNFVVRRVKKMVPAWSLPGHISFGAAVKEGSTRPMKAVAVGPDDIAFLQYTGGTTGISKGAMLLHRNVLANVAQMALWIEDAYAAKPKPAEPIYVCALPLYHIFALTVNALMGMKEGANNILIANPRDIPALVKELKHRSFHIFPGLNTLFNALLNNENFRKLDFRPLILTIGGGMAVQKPVAERWLQATGVGITEGYGLSETSPVATANRFGSAEFTGTIGLPVPSTDISIRDDGGNELPPGEVGEIWMRRGEDAPPSYRYVGAKAKTRPGNWESLGDLGYKDADGYIYLSDRETDMILVGGANVYPAEIEAALDEHPDVTSSCVVGLPDEEYGNAVHAIVQAARPLAAAELEEFLAARLARYKRPRTYEFVATALRGDDGKVRRTALRAERIATRT